MNCNNLLFQNTKDPAEFNSKNNKNLNDINTGEVYINTVKSLSNNNSQKTIKY